MVGFISNSNFYIKIPQLDLGLNMPASIHLSTKFKETIKTTFKF